MDKKVYELMNDQINKELYSGYLYLAFSHYYSDMGLDGFANWYMVQYQEEVAHAHLFIKYLQNNGQKVVLKAIDAPDFIPTDITSPLKQGLEHEKYVTSLIHNIYDAALAAKDYRAAQFLNWFVEEQGEEEKSADDIIKKFENFASSPGGLYSINAELAQRVFTPPSLNLE